MGNRLTRESRQRRQRKRDRIDQQDLHEEVCELDPCTCPLSFNGDVLLWP